MACKKEAVQRSRSFGLAGLRRDVERQHPGFFTELAAMSARCRSAMTSDPRGPWNGRPFYCTLCGAGFGEYIACEMPDCRLESAEEAEERARERDHR